MSEPKRETPTSSDFRAEDARGGTNAAFARPAKFTSDHSGTGGHRGLVLWMRAGRSWWREISLASRLGLFLAFTILTVTSLVAAFQSLHMRSSLTEVSVARNQMRFLSRIDPLERAVWHFDAALAESLLKSAMEGEEPLRITLFEPSGKFTLSVEREEGEDGLMRIVRTSQLKLDNLVPANQIETLINRGGDASRLEPLRVTTGAVARGGVSTELGTVRLASPLFHRSEGAGEVYLAGFVVQDFSARPLRQSIRDAVSSLIAVYTSVALLIFAVTFLVVRRSLLDPLSRLALASLDASRGAFSPVRVTSGADALGVLQRNFNTLMEETKVQFETYEWLGAEAHRIAKSESLVALQEQVRVSFGRFAPPGVEFEMLFSEECFRLAAQGGAFLSIGSDGTPLANTHISAPQILRTYSLAVPVDPSRHHLPKAYVVARDFPFETLLPFTRRVSSLAAACGHCINTFMLRVALTRIDSQRSDLQTLLGTVPVGILLIDERLCIQRDFSRYAENLLGQSNLAGKPFDETFLKNVVPEARYGSARQLLLEAFECEREESEAKLAALPGNVRSSPDEGHADTVLELQWVPMWNIDDRLEKILVTLRDVTELERSRARLAERSRLASLGQMAGGIAHEINNPLAVIQGFAMTLRQLVGQSDPTGEKGGEVIPLEIPRAMHAITRIEATVERAARIVRSLRTFSRDAEKDPFVSYDLGELLGEVFDLCRERFRNNDIILSVAPVPAVHVKCRPVELGQVFLNLLNNAFDALQGDGNQGERKVSVEVVVVDAGKLVQVHVRDNGPGIAKQNSEQIFFPFFTTKEVGKGTGLGLPISLQIVRSHNGRLWFEGGPGETTFVVELACAASGAAPDASDDTAPDAAPLS